MQNKVVIFVPIYKEEISNSEKKSLEQLLLVLNKYQIYFVYPKGLDLSIYTVILAKFPHASFIFHPFPSTFFDNLAGYNQLLTSLKLYRLLKKFDYFLIYQLDAFVFKDELEYWCEQNYDYIGAPWFEHYGLASKDDKTIGVGNGGFSLRNVKKTYMIIRKIYKIRKLYRFLLNLKLDKIFQSGSIIRIIQFIFKIQSHNINFILSDVILNEDFFWSQQIPEAFEFKVSPVSDAIGFCFEVNPSRLYKINGQQLPFGCHAWEKYEPDFWQLFIH